MFDKVLHDTKFFSDHPLDQVVISEGRFFWAAKRVFDLLLSVVLLPVLLFAVVILTILNPFLNKGRMFFVQERMGRNLKPFKAIKLRTMTDVAEILREHDDPIELERITVVGKILRKTRIDEVPQILNVLKGDMSLIGPRPDYYEHAKAYVDLVPGYSTRYSIRPGISGLAQVNLGYSEGIEATQAKTCTDQYYIEKAGILLDSKIAIKTIFTVFRCAGA